MFSPDAPLTGSMLPWLNRKRSTASDTVRSWDEIEPLSIEAADCANLASNCFLKIASRRSAASNAVLHARESSKEQEKAGFSIPAQQKLLRHYARDHDVSIVREFTEVETAKRSGRTGFSDMVAYLKRNSSCRAILVEKTDRLYRNLKDWVTMKPCFGKSIAA